MNYILDWTSTNPHLNLAKEALLLRNHTPGGATLILWQNAHTVVIGSGQNAWRECKLELLRAEGGTLARRITGGGAVYHDLGNVNFSFIVDTEQYNVTRQCGVLLAAARRLGIEANMEGRNDLVIQGRKFSGNAFHVGKNAALHHGTLLVHVDMEKLGRYLSPHMEKLQAKGVASVPARVTNLSEYASVGIADVKRAVCEAFEAEYGDAERAEWLPCAGTAAEIDAERQRMASDTWLLGRTPPFDVIWEKRFDWGMVTLHLSVVKGKVAACRLFTDALMPAPLLELAESLSGVPFGKDAILQQTAGKALPADFVDWLLGCIV